MVVDNVLADVKEDVEVIGVEVHDVDIGAVRAGETVRGDATAGGAVLLEHTDGAGFGVVKYRLEVRFLRGHARKRFETTRVGQGRVCTALVTN